MAVSIGSNIPSLTAQRELGNATSALAQSYQRLSSGQRINQAADDAAGLAIVSQLNSKSRVFTTAIRNVNDGVSAANIAEGALSALKSVSQRQLELSEEAANGTYSTKQRQALNTEANALVNEYNRIVSTTSFNGLSLLDPSLGSVLIQAGYGSSGALQLSLSSQLGRAVGNGTFQTVTSAATAGHATSTVTADVNNDGQLDIITSSNSSSLVSVLLGNGNGTFQAAKSFAGTNPYGLSVGDVNGDGKQDIVATEYTTGAIEVYIGNGDGSFQAVKTYAPTGLQPKSVTLGDLNGDGKLDIIAANYSSNDIGVLLGNGDGTFKAASTYADAGTGARNAIIADLNGDGNVDIAVADGTSNDFSLFLGTGNGTFQAARSVNVPTGLISAADFNGDGYTDILSVGPGSLYVELNNGNGTFQAAQSFAATGTNIKGVSLGDFNGDGLTDVVNTDYADNLIDVFLGNGDGSFQTVKTFADAGTSPRGVAVGDFNDDGRLDIAAGDNVTGNISLFLANGGYTSTSQFLNLNTQTGALAAFNTVSGNLDRIEAQLGSIGATTSRFTVEIANLQTQTENFEAAAGRIQDTDVAQESSNLVREQILQQAAVSVLAQANQSPRLALKLLEN